MSDFTSNGSMIALKVELERIEALLARARAAATSAGILGGDVTGPAGANVLTQILALAGGGTRNVQVNNAGLVIAGTAGGPSTVVWRPGVVSAGNVYATWPEIVAVVATMNGDITIGLDTDFGAAVIAPGAYNLRPVGISGPVTIVNASKAAPFGAPFFVLGPGAVTIAGLTGIDDVSIDNQSTVPVIAVAVDGVFMMKQRATVFQEPGAGPLWSITAGIYSIFMQDFATVTTPGGGTPALVRVAGGVGLLLEDTSAFDTNMMTAAAGVIITVAPAARYFPQAGAPAIIPIRQTQIGSTAIVVGTGKTALIPAFINATSKIVVSLKTPVGDAATVKYASLAADRVVGTPAGAGAFQISALAAAGGGAINGVDTSTIDWQVID